jgi:hypothetical protein
MQRVMEEYPKDQMGILGILKPVLKPCIAREVIGSRGKATNKSTSLRLSLSL